VQADPDGHPSFDEPRLKQHKPNAAEEEGGQQAPTSEGHSTAGEEEAKRQVAGGGEEQGEEAVVGHNKEQGEAAPVAQAAPALPWDSMQPGNTLPHAGCIWVSYHRLAGLHSVCLLAFDQLAFACHAASTQHSSVHLSISSTAVSHMHGSLHRC